jgi:hypothetical protein
MRGACAGGGAVGGWLCGEDPDVGAVWVSSRGRRRGEPAWRFGRALLAVAAICCFFVGKAVTSAVGPVGAAQHHFGHRELGVER